jgi:hypothetical protein
MITIKNNKEALDVTLAYGGPLIGWAVTCRAILGSDAHALMSANNLQERMRAVVAYAKYEAYLEGFRDGCRGLKKKDHGWFSGRLE